MALFMFNGDSLYINLIDFVPVMIGITALKHTDNLCVATNVL